MENIIDHYGTNMTTSRDVNVSVNWNHIIDNFTKPYQTKINKKFTKISLKELQKIEKEYIFNNLTDTQSFGKYFCKTQNIIDFHIIHPINMSYEQQKEYIIKNYIKCKS